MKRGEGVLQAIDQSASLRTRSSLEDWMRKNHDAFAARLRERIADWAVLAKLFEEAGLTDRYGRPPKPEAARKTWQRVRNQVQIARSKASAIANPVPATTPIAEPKQPSPKGAANSADDIRAMLSRSRGRDLPDPVR